MDEKANDLQGRVLRLSKTMKKWPVWNELRDRIERFRATMPLIEDLKNPAMRERHWTELKEEIHDSGFDPDSEAFSLGTLFQLGIQQHAETIGALSAIASREYTIEQSLNEISEKWRVLPVESASYKEGRYDLKSKCFYLHR